MTIDEAKALLIEKLNHLTIDDKTSEPMIIEIHLFDTYISQINSLKDKSILKDLKEQDEFILKKHESKFDETEIGIYKDNIKLGIIPESDSVIFARLMDAGKILKDKLISINTEKGFIRADIGIYLLDY